VAVAFAALYSNETGLDPAAWLALAGFAAAVFLLVELEKAGIRWLFRVPGP
jgi:hypothetical protein